MVAILPILHPIHSSTLTTTYCVVHTHTPQPMDPKFNDEWSASGIRMVKSLIASHGANNNYANNTNKTHKAIMNKLQAWFPQKEKNQLIELYVELLVEMLLPAESVVAVNNLMNDNFGIPMEDPPMKNMDMLLASYVTDKTPEAMGMVDEAPHQRRVLIARQEKQHNEGSWTIEEHWLVFFDISQSLCIHIIFIFKGFMAYISYG